VIHLHNVSKYHLDGHLGHELVLRDASFSLPTDRPVAIIGGDPKAATTLLMLLCGSQNPDKGEILWPPARLSPLIHANGVPGASLVPQFTAADNIRLLAELYGVDGFDLMALVEEACRFGPRLTIPVAKFDWPTRRALELTVIAALPFDCYFVDRLHVMEGPLVWRLLHAAKARGAGVIFSTQRQAQALRIARVGAVAADGAVRVLNNLQESSALA
jgi:ABC-type polysaccharide/polyol phosphate transport system ATPase subunit